MTLTAEKPAVPSAANRFSFSLRTLLLVIVLVAAVAAVAAMVRLGRENRDLKAVLAAHDLATDRSELTADNFLIQVTPLARASDIATYEVAIETLGPWPITVASPTSRSQINIGSKGQPPALIRSNVLITVDLLKSPINQPPDKLVDILRVMAQVATLSKCSAGGPATYHVPAGKTFDELFKMQIKPGLYSRGKAVSLFDLNGEPYTLMVQ